MQLDLLHPELEDVTLDPEFGIEFLITCDVDLVVVCTGDGDRGLACTGDCNG